MNKTHCEYMPGFREAYEEFQSVIGRYAEIVNKDFGIRPPLLIPNVQWLVDIIGALEKDHRFFAKDFRPVKAQRGA